MLGGVQCGFREETPAFDSLLLIIDAPDYLFIHLFSPFLCLPALLPNLKKAQHVGEKEKLAGFIFCGGIKTRGLAALLICCKFDAHHKSLAGGVLRANAFLTCCKKTKQFSDEGAGVC